MGVLKRRSFLYSLGLAFAGAVASVFRRPKREQEIKAADMDRLDKALSQHMAPRLIESAAVGGRVIISESESRDILYDSGWYDSEAEADAAYERFSSAWEDAPE